jgi:hypothetical protein
MTADSRPGRLDYLRVLAVVMIGGQLLVMVPSMAQHWLRDYQLKVQRADSQQRLHELGWDKGPWNQDLKVGLQVSTIPAATLAGKQVDLRHITTERQALLFVSNCASCSTSLIDEYDRLFRSGLDVKVIAHAPGQQIAEARRKYGWRLPCYSDADHPRAAQECRIKFRPAAFVLDRNGRIIYVQGPDHDRESTLKTIGGILRAKSG